MGTAGAGAGGGSGGSRGGGGGGGGGTGAGFLTTSDGSLKDVDPEEGEAWAALQGVFSRLSPEYIGFLVGDDGVRAAYEAIQWMHVVFVIDRSWDKIEERFKIAGGPGCVRLLIEVLSREDGPNPVNPRLQAPLKTALMDFFLKVVDDPVLRDSGDAKEVLAAVKPSVFKSTSAHFFGAYLAESLRIEENSLSKLARRRLRDFSEAKANQLVIAFEDKFKDKESHDIKQVSYAHLFRIMKAEPEWLSEQLRRGLKK
jgi:hypothetical protein